jgi:hypothetical protein
VTKVPAYRGQSAVIARGAWAGCWTRKTKQKPGRKTRQYLFGLGTLSFLAGVFGFARIRREQPGATVFGPEIEQIHDAGHEAGTSA